MKLFTFLFINFIVSFLSDIVLNDLSTFNVIPSLKPYFDNKSIIVSALNAAITVEVALLITISLFYIMFRYWVPTNYKLLLYFCVFAFFVGFALDVFIEKMKIFGNSLDLYYKTFGAGLWGAIAFLFSVLISYFIQKKIVPIL